MREISEHAAARGDQHDHGDYETPERFFSEAIKSGLAQAYPNWELCVADDASKEGRVRKVLEKYAALDPRIKVIYRAQNGHVAAASNSALALATGRSWVFSITTIRFRPTRSLKCADDQPLSRRRHALLR